MKRFLYTLLFSTVFFLGMGMDSIISYAEETETAELIATSGQCGENVYWKIEGTTLTIYGTGDMYDYDFMSVWGGEKKPEYIKNESINKIIVQDGVTSIGECAFYEMKGDVQIGKDVKCIKRDGFYSFQGTEIVIPGNVKEIEDNAFAYSKLNKVVFEEGVQTLRHGAFWRCANLTDVTWANTIEKVEYHVFQDSPWIKDQYDENGLFIKGTMLLGYMENEDEKAIEVTVPEGIISIQGDAFMDTVVEKVNLPDSVTQIGDFSFVRSKIKELNLSDCVTYIGENAFLDCGNLSKIVIPSSVTFIGEGAFEGRYGNKDLERVYEVSKNNSYYSVPDGCNVIYENKTHKVVAGCTTSVIPQDTKIIGMGAFADFDIQEISIPKTLEIIEKGAFRSTDIKAIDLGENLKEVGATAFYGCSKLQKVQLPDTVETIGEYAFYQTQLTQIDLPNKITRIEEGTFYGCPLKMIQLPLGVKYIGANAFHGCNLSEIVVPNKVESIGEFAFAGNDDLTKVEFLNFGAIKEFSSKDAKFSGCSKIKQIICYQCNFGSWKYGHIYSYEDSKDNVIHKDNVNTDDFDWDTLYDRVWNGMTYSTHTYEIHLYAQSKEEVLAGNTQKPELPNNGSGTTRQDNNTTATEKTTEVPKTTEKTTEAVTGETKKSPQITCSKLIKVKLKNLKKHSKKLSLKARTTSDGKLQYKITKYPKGAKKYISVNKKGMVTVKKGAKKGNYVVTITSPETQVYTKMSKNVTIRVK